MQFKAHLESVLETGRQWIIFISRIAVRVAISDLIRCTRIDGFLISNVSNFYEQHSVWMQELEVGQGQCTLKIVPDAPEDNSRHQLTLGAAH
jgi:hypothetical protein